MGLQGSLEGMDLSDLIQLNCQSGERSLLTAQRDGEEVWLYFDAGEIVHAQAGDLRGEEAVYEFLTWDRGTFTVEQGAVAPLVSIEIPWLALVMEGLRRLDEKRLAEKQSGTEAEKEVAAMPEPKKRGERLELAVRNIVGGATALEGVAVVSLDGLIIAATLPPHMEQLRVGAVSAAILNLSNRSVGQLERGDFQQTLIQGQDGNIIITYAGENAAFVGLTAKGANLGMVFLEVREGAKMIAEILES
ncbi:MAG: DUF4388 domain-containing protein [Chloroflexia bacterium]|nr:DUF4388 domain-containing protein [Chloroflexia bacterium]